MAVGDFTADRWTVSIRVIENGTGTTAAPTLSTDGINLLSFQRSGVVTLSGSIVLKAAVTPASTGTVQLRVWLYFAGPGIWAPAGVGGDATKGLLNSGNTLGETGTDEIVHSEVFEFLGHATRVYFQTTVAGNIADLDAWLVLPKLMVSP